MRLLCWHSCHCLLKPLTSSVRLTTRGSFKGLRHWFCLFRRLWVFCLCTQKHVLPLACIFSTDFWVSHFLRRPFLHKHFRVLLEHTFRVLSKTRLTSRLQLFQLIFKDTLVQLCSVWWPKSWFRVVQVVHWGTTFEGRGGLGPPPPHPPPSACLLFIGFQNHYSTKILF